MTINFSLGDWVIPNQTYITTLKSLTKTPLLKQSLGTLAGLIETPSQILEFGGVSDLSYIKVRPNNKHPFYKGGAGVIIYFSNDEILNNSFESSKAFLPDQEIVLCLNNSGGILAKSRVVRQTGFDSTQQLPTIALADASTEANSIVLGILQEDVADNAVAGILVDGSFQYNTSGFSLGAMAYLSDTPGMIAATIGTVGVTIGRVLSVATEGTISLFSTLTGGATGDSGGGGSSGSLDLPVIDKTADFTADSAGTVRTYSNQGAIQNIVGTFDTGLPAGHITHFVRLEPNWEFIVRAPTGEQIRKSADGVLLDEGLGVILGQGATTGLKKDNQGNWFIWSGALNINYETSGGGGLAWSLEPSGTVNNLRGMWAWADDSAFTVGDDGTILQYTGGIWTSTASGTTVQLNDIHGEDGTINGYAVGNGGTILRWDGGSGSWSSMGSGTISDLNGVWMCSIGENVFTAGASGTILRWNGSTWSAMTSGTTSNLNSIWINADGSAGFAVGAVSGGEGTVRYWDGLSWSPMSTGTTVNLTGVWGYQPTLADPIQAFVVGDSGTILHWDGGSWGSMTSGTTLNLKSVWGTDASSVFAVGDDNGGVIEMYEYNGSAWSTTATGLPGGTLYDVYGSSRANIWACGRSGAILHGM